ncbi:lia operon protein LiaH [Metabacillus sp. SLBN-84]
MMSNLFTRIKETLAADFHEILDHKEKKNPIALLNQYLRECEQETDKVRKLVERQYLLKEEFTRELKQAEELAGKRKRQADIAAQAGESELHEFAVREHEQYQERSVRITESLKEVSGQLAELERKYEEMKHKLKDMYIKRMELMGRENTARASHRMNKVLDSSSYSHGAHTRFDELESYIDRLENEVNTGYYRSTIDGRIAQLEKELKKEDSAV